MTMIFTPVPKIIIKKALHTDNTFYIGTAIIDDLISFSGSMYNINCNIARAGYVWETDTPDIVVNQKISSALRFRFDKTDIASINGWKNFLSTQYTNGTPVTVYYQLATPIEENITLPTISTSVGTNIITATDSNGIHASNISIKY